MRQRADHLHPPLGKPAWQVRAARHQEDREVAPIDHVLAAFDASVDQVAKVRVQLRRPACDVHRAGGGVVQGRQAEVDGLPVHVLRDPVRTGVDVAVPAGHVAEPAEVDLEDLQGGRLQLVPARFTQHKVEVASGE